MTAPTDGAEVSVQRIDVLGNVEPATAAVVVGGRRVHVVAGAFRQPMTLLRGLSHIEIAASAAGYVPEHLSVAVRSSPRAIPTPKAEVAERSAAGGELRTTANSKRRYSARLQSGMLRICEAETSTVGASYAYCECYVEHLEAREPESVLIKWERAFVKGKATLPKWIREASSACKPDIAR